MPSDRSEIEDCFEFIKTKQDQGYDLIFFPNPGNSGDAVIACATIQQLEKRRIRCTLARSGMQHKPSNYYIYSGGGNLVPFYADAAKVLASLSRQKAGLCVLPHSCFGVDSVLQLYEGDLTIFAREATTQRYLRSLDARHLTIKIDHDIGLSLDMEDPRLAMPRTFNALYGNAGRRQSLCILRNDCESVANPLLAGKDSIDISNLWPKGFPSRGFGVTYLDAPLVFNCVSWFLSLLAPSAVIHTDRLHVGIAAALLGKEVYLYDNRYKKISAVYEFSLKDRPGLNVKLG